MANWWPILKGTGMIGGGIAGSTAATLDAYKDEPWVRRLRGIMHPDPGEAMPEDPRIGGYRMGSTVEPAPDEAAMAQDARETAARRVRGELAPSAAVERRFGAFAEPSAPPGPTRAEAFQMGGLAEMGAYEEAPKDFYKKADVAGAERDVAPDPGMNPFAASPQQTRVARAHGAVPDALLIPTSPVDAALLALGPAGKIAGVPGKIAAMTAGLMASDIGEAHAGALGKMGKVLGGAPGGPHPGGIHVYHSSPHDFDRFDWSKLRTGEGANMYGSGFYFAENPAVSGQGGQYWNQFSKRFRGDESTASTYLQAGQFDRERAAENLHRSIYDTKQAITNGKHSNGQVMSPEYITDQIEYLNQQRRALKLLESGAPVGPRTYEVNINARPELLLDWDKPIRQQDAAINALAARLGMDPRDNDVVKGAALYRRAGDYFGPKQATSDFDKAASEGMRDYGIPGIRYLDQGSRAQATPEAIANLQASIAKKEAAHQANPWLIDTEKNAWGTRNLSALDEERKQLNQMLNPSYNYVVTDPSKLDILAKYGVAGGVPMGALAAQDRYGAAP